LSWENAVFLGKGKLERWQRHLPMEAPAQAGKLEMEKIRRKSRVSWVYLKAFFDVFSKCLNNSKWQRHRPMLAPTAIFDYEDEDEDEQDCSS
jgi:hypothetical protein